MDNLVDATIANLRSVVNASSNAELAQKLGVDQSTISSWRARGRVPNKFIKFLREPANISSAEMGDIWPEMTSCATAVALVRYTLLRHEVASSGEVDRGLSVFLTLKPWWFVVHRAAHDLRSKMEALGIDLKTAQALIMQYDLRDPAATAGRVEQQLAEDLHDNPLLLNYE